jgi:hypothetical protein
MKMNVGDGVSLQGMGSYVADEINCGGWEGMWRIGSNLEDGKEVDGCWFGDGMGFGK